MKNVGERRSSRLFFFFFLLEKLSLAKDIFLRERKIRKIKKKKKEQRGNKGKKLSVIFPFRSLSLSLSRRIHIELNRFSTSFEDHFRSISRTKSRKLWTILVAARNREKLKRQDGSTNSRTFPICLPRAAGMYTSIRRAPWYSSPKGNRSFNNYQPTQPRL